MKIYDLIIRTKRNRRFYSEIGADNYKAAKESLDIVLNQNTFITCNTEEGGDCVFLAVSEIAYIALLDNPEENE